MYDPESYPPPPCAVSEMLPVQGEPVEKLMVMSWPYAVAVKGFDGLPGAEVQLVAAPEQDHAHS